MRNLFAWKGGGPRLKRAKEGPQLRSWGTIFLRKPKEIIRKARRDGNKERYCSPPFFHLTFELFSSILCGEHRLKSYNTAPKRALAANGSFIPWTNVFVRLRAAHFHTTLSGSVTRMLASSLLLWKHVRWSSSLPRVNSNVEPQPRVSGMKWLSVPHLVSLHCNLADQETPGWPRSSSRNSD